ncbi:MAG: helix-turn-helix domain-containing protein [Rikenellaceae bacterium]|nr:helix-turn-helix domain-containing protein [Rikenellaceae bacterium]MCL2693118.1 helix-turn-helix domain-containing protein [Rikenellaceae bacterium]
MERSLSDNILSLIGNAPDSILLAVAERVRSRRLERNWTQKLLASKAGMPPATYRRFESKGEVSLRGLLMIAFALGMENNFADLFTKRSYENIDELMAAEKTKERKRGGRNE